jgi:hypothetical protein
MANLILWNTFNLDYAALRPAGAHQLAVWLTQFGYTVKVIDFCSLLSTDDLVSLTEKHIDSTTIAIGVSSTFWHSNESIANTSIAYDAPLATSISLRRGPDWGPELTRDGMPNWVTLTRARLRSKYPALDWLIGGSHAHTGDASWIKFYNHSEDTLLKYLDEKSNKIILRSNFDITKKGNGFMDKLGIQPHEVLPLELGRGCQFKCGFCNYPLLGKRKGTYIRDFSLIKEELISNFEKFGTTRYFFVDDTMNESIEKIDELAEMAQTLPFKLEWIGYNRLDIIGSTRTQIESLKYSGLRSTFFGIESFGLEASKAIGKPWNGKNAKDFLLELKSIWKNDITFELGFIVGLTGDSPDDLDKTEQWCIDNGMHSWLYHALHIYRNNTNKWASEFDKNYAAHGYKFLSPIDNTRWTNDTWDYRDATLKSFQLNVSGREHKKAAGYQLGEPISAGYAIDDIIDKYKKDLDWNSMRSFTAEFLKNYVKFQLNL